MGNARILDDRQVGAEREFLKDAAHPHRPRARHVIGHNRLPGAPDLALLGHQPAIDDRDDGGFARAVMPDQPDALARPDRQRHAVQSHDLAEPMGDAGHVQDGRGTGVCHEEVGPGEADGAQGADGPPRPAGITWRPRSP